jgi:hypothetical protein
MRFWKIDWTIDPGVIRGMPAGLKVSYDEARDGVVMISGTPEVAGRYEFDVDLFEIPTRQFINVFDPAEFT